LIFRSIIINKTIQNGDESFNLNIDPFAECITLPSLAVKINSQNFIIPNTIESYTDSKKRDSKKAIGWLYHIQTKSGCRINNIYPEFNLKVIYSSQTQTITAKSYNRDIDAKIPDGFKFEYHFKGKNIYLSLSLDGFDPRTNTIYEFYGDYWHGNPDIQQYRDTDLTRIRHEKQLSGRLYLRC
jgi:hypothetical protein